jgi:predicted transcriptional regulator
VSVNHRQAALQVKDVRGNTRLLLFVLANFASDGKNLFYPNTEKPIEFGWLFVSSKIIMKAMNIQRRETLRKCLHRLIKKKLIKRARRGCGESWKTFVDIAELQKNSYPHLNGKSNGSSVGVPAPISERERIATELRTKIKTLTHQFLDCKNTAEKKRIAKEIEPLKRKLGGALSTGSADEIEKFLNAVIH